MFSAKLFSLGFVATLLNATARQRPAITETERTQLQVVWNRIDRRLNDLEPELAKLEAILEERKSSAAPPATQEEIEEQNRLQAILGLQIDLQDETHARIHDCPTADDGSRSEAAAGLPRGSVSGVWRPRIGSQDPGALPGDYRRTGVITDIGIVGKAAGNPQVFGTIKLDHPQSGELKAIHVFESSYADPQPDGRAPKAMRRGDWISFVVVEGSSSKKAADGSCAKKGRVMAGDVRKIGYLSAAERQQEEWLEVFQGGLVGEDGRSVAPDHAEGGTPYWQSPANPKSVYARSRAARSEATGFTWTSGRTGRSGSRNRRARDRSASHGASHSPAPQRISLSTALPAEGSDYEVQLGQDADSLVMGATALPQPQAERSQAEVIAEQRANAFGRSWRASDWYWDYEWNCWCWTDANGVKHAQERGRQAQRPQRRRGRNQQAETPVPADVEP